MKEGIILVVYIDDVIFAGSSGEELEAEISNLGVFSARNFHSLQLRKEGEVIYFLFIMTCLQFAKMPKICPCTNHIGLPYLWFRDKVFS